MTRQYYSCTQILFSVIFIPRKPGQIVKRANTSIVMIVFDGIPVKYALVLLSFLSIALHESGTRKSYI